MKGRNNAAVTTGPQDLGRRARATLALGFICIVLFVWTWEASGWPVLQDAGRLDPMALREAGALDWLLVRDEGAWWRLFSAVLLHGSWWHLALNLWALFVLGGTVERRFGRARWGAIVALSAVGSGLAALAWGAASMVVGISGVVFGFGGYLVARDVLARTTRLEIRREPSTQSSKSPISDRRENAAELSSKELSFWLAVTLALGVIWPELSQAGHVGGLITGAVLAGLEAGWLGALLATIALMAGGGAAVASSLAVPDDSESWERLGYALLDAERPAEAWPCFDAAIQAADAGDDRVPEWKNASAYARAIGSRSDAEWRVGIRLVTESLEADPENPNRLDTLGWLQCQLGEIAAGHQTLVRAAELMPEGPTAEVSEHLAACSLR